MKINQIRPENLDLLAAKAYKKDLEFYRSNKDMFIDRLCPGCKLESGSTFFVKDEFEYTRCLGCLCIFMNPGPTEELVEQLYKQSETYKFWSDHTYPISKEERMRTIHKERAEWVLNHMNIKFPNQEIFRILELGAGTGDTLVSIVNESTRRTEVYATEPNPSMAPHLKLNEIRVLTDRQLSSKEFVGKFDAVMCFEVLEHLLDPSIILSQVYENLKSQGLFFASTPNAQSLEVQLLRDESTTIDIEHITVLAPSSIHALSNMTRFGVTEITTPGKFDLELLRRAGVSCSLARKNQSLATQEVQEFVHESGFASHMKIVLAKK